MELIFDIPPCPDFLIQFSAELERDDINVTRICELVQSDVGLAAAVLRLANSALFAGARNISSIQTAVHILGLSTLKALATGVALEQALGGPKADLHGFWANSVNQAMRLTQLSTEEPHSGMKLARSACYVFGLFKDAGEAILLLTCPTYAADKKNLPASADLIKWQRQRYGTDHAQLGYILAERWQLPSFISLAIRDHHTLASFGASAELDRSSQHLMWLAAVADNSERELVDAARTGIRRLALMGEG